MTTSQSPHTLLVVDDAPENIDLLCAILEPHYSLKVATHGEKALKIVLSDTPPDLILLDIVMPGMDGYEVCRRIKAHPERHHIPIMFVTAKEQQEDEELGLSLGAEDYITKPFSAPIVLARVRTHLALYDQTRELERRVNERTRELQESRLEIIKRLGRAAEFRDNETGYHVLRMSHYSGLIARAAGLGEAVAQTLFLAAPMHDIGKIGTPDYILLKPGKLDPDEWDIMKQHVTMGAEILGEHPDELLSMARTVALSHHERWDGKGYPLGLKGKEIPMIGQIVAMADVFDALTSERPYKKAWPLEDAIKAIEDNAGSHFDPDLLPAFRRALPEMLKIREQYTEPPDVLAMAPVRAQRQ
jgi:putative two-component system response regulator